MSCAHSDASCSKRQYQVQPQHARKENSHVHVNLVCVCNNVSIVRTFPTLWYFCFVWRFTILIIRPSREPSWLWSYSSWIYNYLCNQCLLPLKLWVRIASLRGVLDTTLCNKVFQWIVWQVGGFLLSVSSSNKTDRHDTTQILLKVALNTISLNPIRTWFASHDRKNT